jgi:hypothetical protein
MLAGMGKTEIGAGAPDLVLYGAAEEPVELAQLQGGHPLVAIFLRHFG